LGPLNDILLQTETDNISDGIVIRIVLPKSRSQVLQVAHDQLGHLGYKKMLKTLRRNFTWPLLSKDVITYSLSCTRCQKHNKGGQGKVPVIERTIISEPFEQMVLDLVGPLPKAKGGHQYLLTAVCMATKWPVYYCKGSGRGSNGDFLNCSSIADIDGSGSTIQEN